MRELLKPYFGNTLKFRGKVEAFQRDKLKRRSSHFAVVRLTNVTLLEQTATIRKTPTKIAEQVITDHIWIESGKWAKKLNTGDTVVFTARVSSYSKQNWRGDIIETDFGLFRPKYIEHQKGRKQCQSHSRESHRDDRPHAKQLTASLTAGLNTATEKAQNTEKLKSINPNT